MQICRVVGTVVSTQKNKKLEAQNRAFNNEKKTIEAQNADLAKKHDAIKAAEKPIVTTPK